MVNTSLMYLIHYSNLLIPYAFKGSIHCHIFYFRKCNDQNIKMGPLLLNNKVQALELTAGQISVTLAEILLRLIM